MPLWCLPYVLTTKDNCCSNSTTNLGGGLNPGKLESWNESIDCCQWSGVTCDHDGHVIDLDLSGELVFGEFNSSSSLFGLHYLESLKLVGNF